MTNIHITLINVIKVPVEAIKQFIIDWQEAKDFMIRQPSLIDGTIYRSLQVESKSTYLRKYATTESLYQWTGKWRE